MRKSSLLFSLAMLLLACEKEQMSSPAVLSTEDATLVEAINVQIHESAPAYSSLDVMPVNLRNGTLVYEDVMALRRALNTFSLASDEDYQNWANSIGFNSPYLQYLNIYDQLVHNESPVNKSILSTEQAKFIEVTDDGTVRFKVPSFGLMKIINLSDGIFEAGQTINYYTTDRHFIIPDQQYEVLQKVQQDLFQDYSSYNVEVEHINVTRARKTDDEQKVAQAGTNCPMGLLIGINGQQMGIDIRALTDERVISGNRKKLESHHIFWNSLVIAGSQREVLMRMEVGYENLRKSWFTFIGTQPGTLFAEAVDFNNPSPQSDFPTPQPITVDRNFRVFRTFLGGLSGWITLFDYNGPIMPPSTNLFTDPRGDTRGEGVFDDYSFEYFQPLFVGESGFDPKYIMVDGAARVFWPILDPRNGRDHVSGDFFCN